MHRWGLFDWLIIGVALVVLNGCAWIVIGSFWRVDRGSHVTSSGSNFRERGD